MLLDELVEIIQDLALTFGERKHASSCRLTDLAELAQTICEQKAKIKIGIGCYTRKKPDCEAPHGCCITP